MHPHGMGSPLRPDCRSGKIRFRTELDAKLALASTALAGKKAGPAAKKRHEWRYYRCPHCRGYHLSSTPSKPKKKRKKRT